MTLFVVLTLHLYMYIKANIGELHEIIEGQKTAPMFGHFVWLIKQPVLIGVT